VVIACGAAVIARHPRSYERADVLEPPRVWRRPQPLRGLNL
jgi:hypothetical protein